MTDKRQTIRTEQEAPLLQDGTTMASTATTTEEKHHKIVRRKIGICMDHSGASLIGFSNNPTQTTTIESSFTHEVKEQALGRSENVMHNKEQQQQKDFYKKISTLLKNYDEVLLFGPTDAKVELYNILKADSHFDKISIEVKHSDKMTENQQHAFVQKHFSGN